MSDPYQGAWEFHFTGTYNNNLLEDDLIQATKDWHDYVQKAKPLTQEIYRALSDEERKLYHPGGPLVFVPAGGLTLIQNRDSHRVYGGISGALKKEASRRALESRKEWGWSGANYLVDPNGHTKPPWSNGLPYGEFTRGDGYLVITEDEVVEPKPPREYTP